MTIRTILHLDLDAFFCAVEINLNPELDKIPFAVGGKPDQRGVVASCSYPARVFGVRSAMPMARAVQLCPDLVIVSHQHGEYGRVSKQVMAILRDLTPLVEQLSIDEAFLDVTGLRGTPQQIAARLQAQINDDLQLPCSLGVATNKLVAKIANNIGKASAKGDSPPNAIKVIPPGNEADFLAPLPIRELWGIGPKTEERLNKRGIYKIGQLARVQERELDAMFGKLGRDLARRSKGIDDRPVTPEHETKSISKETTYARDIHDEEILLRTLRKLADGVGYRLRKAGLQGRTVTIKLRWSDFTTLSRQITLNYSIDQDEEIYHNAQKLFNETWIVGKAVRLLGVGVSGFEEQPQQLSLWQDDSEQIVLSEQDRKLQSALDAIRSKFGEQSVKRGSELDIPDHTDEHEP